MASRGPGNGVSGVRGLGLATTGIVPTGSSAMVYYHRRAGQQLPVRGAKKPRTVGSPASAGGQPAAVPLSSAPDGISSTMFT